MDSLNVFKVGKLPWTSPRNWVGNIRFKVRQLKWAYQRAIRGYADCDTWNLDYFYAKLLAESLEAYASNLHGWPESERFPECEDWENYIIEMAHHFRDSLEDGKIVNPYEEEFFSYLDNKDSLTDKEAENLRKLYYKVEEDNFAKRIQERNKALEMLQSVFGDLWD